MLLVTELDLQEGPLLERCAKNYIRWRQSPPMSLGSTTSKAFTAGNARNNQAAEMIARSALENGSSQSNGALMRASPLGIALHNRDDDTIARFAGEAL